MTFSDAEEDQPTGMQNGATTPTRIQNGATTPTRIQNGATTPTSLSASPSETQNASPPDNQAAATSSSAKAESLSPTPVDAPTPPSQGAVSLSTSSSETPSSTNNSSSLPTSAGSVSQSLSSDTDASSSLNRQMSNDTSRASFLSIETGAGGSGSNAMGIETEKIMEKLQQIHGYIQQTASAMQALEQEGNLSKIGQYNTLAKCLRELKKSEAKLTSHLGNLRAKENRSQMESDNVNETNQTQRGSESMGVIGNMTEEGTRPSLQDRLLRHENEQQQLSERLRESLVRREELMARYQATRERLNNLKRQRMGIVHEERRLLQSVGAPDNPYDDPIPGAETWSIPQLQNAIKDFKGLRDKVDRLHEAYTTKLQVCEESDPEAVSDLQRKLEQIVNKKVQIGNALNHMTQLLQVKRERDETEANLSNLESQEGNIRDGSPGNLASEERRPSCHDSPRLPAEGVSESREEETVQAEGALSLAPDPDLLTKQRHLQALKDQLNAMKRLLQVTQDTMAVRKESEERNPLGTAPDNNQLDVEEDGQDALTVHEEVEPLVDSTIVGVNGEVIHLTESERRNPQVISKFQQLSEAKQRLAKMEEVMMKIAEARQSGLPLQEALSPENMAILNEAREEEEDKRNSPFNSNNPRDRLNSTDRNSEAFRTSVEPPKQTHRTANDPGRVQTTPAKKNESNRLHESSLSSARPEWERERELTAMHFHLNKKAAGIPSVNEGFKIGAEKGAIKKQTRELLAEAGGRGCDPRLMEVITLQEELREKKNALEALMRRMGKSSSFAIDNISDNLSENVSDNEGVDKTANGPWGSNHGRSYSEDDLDLIDRAVGPVFNRHHPAAAATPPTNVHGRHASSSSHNKNKNRYSPQKQYRNADGNQFSVNNLNGSLPNSVRPKHNQYVFTVGAPNGPVASWETVSNPHPATNIAPPNQNLNHNPNPNKVQNTVASALCQLGLVQETINSLYGELRAAELSSRQQDMPIMNAYGSNMILPQQAFNATPQNLLPNYALTPLPNSQGRGDLGASNHILAGLQHCFSQLYLHSLEIQSLNKHLQIIDQREKSVSPSHSRPETRGGSAERRVDRHTASRRGINESVEHGNFSQHRLDSHFSHPATSPPCYTPRSTTHKPPPIRESGLRPRNGVSNPLYARISNGQTRPSWLDEANEELDLEFGNQKFFPPFDGSASDDVHQPSSGDLLLDVSSQFPLDADDLADEVPWTSASNPHIHQPSSDILNNQVLPGTRANNYWDNFRSYSRQNPLSTTAKSNTGEQHSISGSSTSGRGQSLNTNYRLQPSLSFENKNRHYNITTFANNSINKASDKNSSSTRSQNKGGARARYGHQGNGRRTAAANSPYMHNVTPSSTHPENEDRKGNNRSEPRPSYNQESFSVPESNQNLIATNNEDTLLNGNVLSHNTNHSRRSETERRNSTSRNSEEVLSTGAVERQNAASSHEDLSTSEAFSQVVREAESLMQKHSQQPQFLLQLFHHASKITSNTDQQVALELLKELSCQRAHNNNIQNNRWTSNSSVTQSDNFSLPTPLREANYRNITHFSNKNSRSPRGISGSDASESGITSDEEDTKVLYQMVKNLTPTSSSAGVYTPLRSSPLVVFSDPPNNPGSIGASPIRALNAQSHNQQLLPESQKDFSKDISNIITSVATKQVQRVEEQQLCNRIQPRLEEDIACNPISGTVSMNIKSNCQTDYSHYSLSPLGEKHNNRRQMRKSLRRNLAQTSEEKSNFLSKDVQKSIIATPPAAANESLQEPVLGFEAIVSSALREVLMCFESADYSLTSTSQILDKLLNSIMKQVQLHSSTLGFSNNFVASIDSQLRNTLRSFYGKSLAAIRQDLAASVTQVLVQEYCSLCMHQDNALDTRQNANEAGPVNESRPAIQPSSEISKRSFTKQPTNANSLFGSQDTVHKQEWPLHAPWVYSTLTQGEGSQGNREQQVPLSSNIYAQPRDEDLRSEPAFTKGKGAIAKKSGSGGQSHSEDPQLSNQERPSAPPRQSPLPEVSSFPESWVVQRSTSSEGEGLYSLPESSFLREREDDAFLDALAKQEYNDAEADQDEHARNSEFLNLSLPVHDLAEADQSQDQVDVKCVNSGLENGHYETPAASYPQPLGEPKDFAKRFLAKKKDNSEQGLDEVPTRLLSASEGFPSPHVASGRQVPEEPTETKVHPHRYGPFPPQMSSPPAHANSGPHGEANAPPNGVEGQASSSGKGG